MLIWFLQSSLWAALLVLGVPIWRHVDLLPVVDQVAADAPDTASADPAEAQEDGALAHVLDAGHVPMDDKPSSQAG